MSTNIEWARNPDGSKGETWPVVTGCSHSGTPGCDHCYAARMAATRLKHHPRYEGLATISGGKARWTGKVNFNRDVLDQPLHWRKSKMVFVASMGDWLHPDVHESFIYRVLDVTQRTPQHIYQFLTKRADRLPVIIKDWMLDRGLHKPPRNVWQGISIENQAAADERTHWLLQTPAAVRFVSVEPMLAKVDLRRWWSWNWDNVPFELTQHNVEKNSDWFRRLSWVICGGESGPGARPMHPDWARSLRDQCQAAGVPFFFKSWGAWAYDDQLLSDGLAVEQAFPSDNGPFRVGKKRTGNLLDGRAWQQFPVITGALT